MPSIVDEADRTELIPELDSLVGFEVGTTGILLLEDCVVDGSAADGIVLPVNHELGELPITVVSEMLADVVAMPALNVEFGVGKGGTFGMVVALELPEFVVGIYSLLVLVAWSPEPLPLRLSSYPGLVLERIRYDDVVTVIDCTDDAGVPNLVEADSEAMPLDCPVKSALEVELLVGIGGIWV